MILKFAKQLIIHIFFKGVFESSVMVKFQSIFSLEIY
jgi:hypothetical protein